MRVYEAIAPEQAEGMRLDKYISLAFSLLPSPVTRDAFSHRDVKADGKRMNRDAAVHAGQRIQVYTNYEVSLPLV